MTYSPLLANIIQQRSALLAAGKAPRALRIDVDSEDALQRELSGSGVIALPGLRVLGLVIERSPEPNVEVVAEDEVENKEVTTARAALNTLTDEQRADLFAEYCVHCGSTDRRCQCANDE